MVEINKNFEVLKWKWKKIWGKKSFAPFKETIPYCTLMLNYCYNVSNTQERELKKDYFSKKKIFCEEPDENKV